MPIRSYIPTNEPLACECMGAECDSVEFSSDALELEPDVLAITGRADQVAASTRAGSLFFERGRNRLRWRIADDAPRTPALDQLLSIVQAGTAVYARPLINEARSVFTESGTLRRYTRAVVRALLVKPILEFSRTRGWERVTIGDDRMEQRFCEFRATPEGVIEGVVMRYGSEAVIGDFRERFEAGALRYDDVIVNLMHQRTEPVARTDAGLTFSDGAELRARIELPDTVYGRRARELAAARILRGFSVEFVAREERWEGRTRIVQRADLTGIGLVDRPAYPDSVIASRMAASMPRAEPKPRRRAL